MPEAYLIEYEEEPTLFDYMCMVVNAVYMNHSWRRGQAYFNVLREIRPDLSEAVRSGPIDPFHRDEVINQFLFFVVGSWNNPPGTVYLNLPSAGDLLAAINEEEIKTVADQ